MSGNRLVASLELTAIDAIFDQNDVPEGVESLDLAVG